MLINIDVFKTLLKKATLNHSIENVQLNLTKDTITSKMITSFSDGIAILNVPNTLIPDLPRSDNFSFSFSEPNTTLVPFLNLIDENEETKINIHDEKITLVQGKQKSNIFFCAPQVVSVFEADAPRPDISYFKSFQFDDDFMESFAKIKKIGSKFNKIYFGVDKKVLYVETSDRQNRFSNGLKIDLCDVDYSDMVMCFDFKNIVNALTIITGEHEEFTINFAYIKEQELGMIYINKADMSEKYYLMSKKDN